MEIETCLEINQEKLRQKTIDFRALIVPPCINYDGCPVMIDRISMSKYQRLQSTIAHRY